MAIGRNDYDERKEARIDRLHNQPREYFLNALSSNKHKIINEEPIELETD